MVTKAHSFERICRDHGLKITPQRAAIYRELIGSKEHPSAVTIHRKVKQYFPNVSLDTVNRTLLTFHRMGLAKTLEFSGEAKRFDPNLRPHHHFKCIRCGEVIDFYSDAYDLIEIPDELEERFTVLEKRVYLEGICDQCRL